MQLRCPKCGTWIPPDAVNVAFDLAKCGECGELLKPSTPVGIEQPQEELEQPAGSKISFWARGESEALFVIPRPFIKGEHLLAELFGYASRPLRDFFGEQGPE